MPVPETDEPYIALATEEGTVTFREYRPDGTTRHLGARVRVVVTELMPATYPDLYGVIVCKSYGDKSMLLSVTMDTLVKFISDESSRSVQLIVHSDNALEWLSRVTLAFDEFLDWAECSRILGQAKAQQGQRDLQLRDQLNLVRAQQFSPASPPPESPGVTTPTPRRTVEQQTQTAA